MGVEFNENKPLNYDNQPKKVGMNSLIIKTGLAKDEAGAQKVMIVITILCFVISIYFFLKI